MGPNRSMVKLEDDTLVKTELREKWYMARVFDLDASLVKMTFPDSLGCEWIYRGSLRLEPIILMLEQEKGEMENANQESKHARKEAKIGGFQYEINMKRKEPVSYVAHICNKSC